MSDSVNKNKPNRNVKQRLKYAGYKFVFILCLIGAGSANAATQGEWGKTSTAKIRVSVTIADMKNPGVMEVFRFGACTKFKTGRLIKNTEDLDKAKQCLSKVEVVEVESKDSDLIRITPV